MSYVCVCRTTCLCEVVMWHYHQDFLMDLCRHFPFTQMFVLHVGCVSVSRSIPIDFDVIVPFRHSASCQLAIGEFQSTVWDEVSAVWIKQLVEKHEVVIAQGKSGLTIIKVWSQLILDGWSGTL